MNPKIMSRPMFSGPKQDVNNVGIMQGFAEDDGEEMGMEPEQEAAPSDRSPNDPEVLMNNLRGDYRSVDARYMELAQMVGEDAASQTPPEVLAMLQMQMAAPAGGIGDLQGAPGMPPAAPEMPAAAGGIGGLPQAPQAPMPQAPMPQPQQAMPPGMAGAGPFPQGGAEQAPPTPDGLPPAHAVVGGLMTQAARLGPYLAGLGSEAAIGARLYGQQLATAARPYTERVATAARPYMEATNQALGRMTMTPQPIVGRMLGSDGLPVAVQGREALIRGPGGELMMGQGSKFIPNPQTVTGVRSPSLTEGLNMGAREMLQRYLPAGSAGRASIGASAAGIPLAGAAVIGSGGERGDQPDSAAMQALDRINAQYVAQQNRPSPQLQEVDRLNAISTARVNAERAAQRNLPPALPPVPAPGTAAADLSAVGASTTPTAAEEAATAVVTPGATQAEPAVTTDRLRTLLAPASTPADRISRIKAARDEYAPLFQELLGDTKKDTEINALLLLADAGLKLTRSTGRTPLQQIAEGASGLPAGFAALASQNRELEMKARQGALQQGISDVTEQDKAQRDMQKLIAQGDMRIMLEWVKKNGGKTEDAGLGGRITLDRNGSFVGFGIDDKDPAVKTAIESRYTLRPTNNPFVMDRGAAPTTIETDKAERVKLGNTLRALDNSLSTLDSLKGEYVNAYRPGTWAWDKSNNLLVPLLPEGLVKPLGNIDLVASKTRINTGLNSILKNIASANDSGRVAVQEQEWARQTASEVSNPTAFFQDPQLAAKQFVSMEAMLRNARQNVLTQLGFEKNDYAMTTPSTGTRADPFVLPADPKAQEPMLRFLASTIGKVQNEKATVHIQLPNGTVQTFNPSALRGLVQEAPR
jgi:hypothetical protein